ncbi:hypothetical protein ACQKL5_07250 [Peribacillus sp. NPDC097675]|uniref:hypothetical protein n=1 Tax=Peribacillus sp. NPDC097675 TaxID=3390618 RepID=UPI003D037585
MRILLELIRILLIFGIAGAFCSSVLANVYQNFGISYNQYGYLGSVAILILLFVLYRNKLQFSGWYKGKKEKLPKRVTRALFIFSIVLLSLPPLLQFTS